MDPIRYHVEARRVYLDLKLQKEFRSQRIRKALHRSRNVRNTTMLSRLRRGWQAARVEVNALAVRALFGGV